MALLEVRITKTGVAGIGRRELQAVGRKAISDTALLWWRELLPIHFSRRALRLYHYRPRQGDPGSGAKFRGSYAEGKVKRRKQFGKIPIGENKPYVFTGESRERATSAPNIVAKARNYRTYSADVVINAPALNFVPDSRDEITRTTPAEVQRLEQQFAESYEADLVARGRTVRKTKRIAA